MHVYARARLEFWLIWSIYEELTALKLKSRIATDKSTLYHKTPEKVPFFFHELLYVSQDGPCSRSLLPNKTVISMFNFCTQKLSICMFDFCWSCREKVFRWQNEKHFSLDYAFRTNSLLQGKTLSLTLWSTPMLNISMFFETNTATRKWDIVRLNFNSNTNASDNMIDFFLLGFDLNILSYFEAYLTHTQLSTVSSVSASRPWQVYTGARRICPLCLKASDQKLQKAPSKNLIKIKEWKKN